MTTDNDINNMIAALMGLLRVICLVIIISSCLFQLTSSFQSQYQVRRKASGDLHLSFNDVLISPGADDEEKENLLNRWEQMYYEAEQAEKGDIIDEKEMFRSVVRVVTFDLDNTVWKTKPCISSANNALAVYLDTHNIKQPKRVEKIMGDLFQANKTEYSPRIENATAPVLLTKLRKDALKEVLTAANGYTEEEATVFAGKAFECWTTARHEAIPRNFATDVLGCLKKISSIRTPDERPVLIGAITDGNSDPRYVDELRDYFDFCVNAESVGVSKPDRRVYLEAARYVLSHPDFRDLGRIASDNEDALDDAIGPYWVHVGDDFSKDVVAAKTMKMRTIWAQELIHDKLPKAAVESDVSKTTSLEDFVRKVSEQEVVEMAIGGDNYLADAMTQEFADSVATTFSEVGEILCSWHQSALGAKNTGRVEAAIEVTMPDISASPNEENVIQLGDSEFLASAARFRTFRLVRNDCFMDVPAPSRNREEQKMLDVMTLAQLDKSSGVFSFPAEEVELLQQGKRTLMIEIGTTGIKFSREIFASMTVDEVLSLSDENPVTLNLFMQESFDSPSFDLF